MAAGMTTKAEREASGWVTLLVVFGIASTIEAFSVAHVFRFLPLYLGTVGVPPAEVPAWTGYLNATFFVFGLPLVPFWGVWAERYGRIPVIARSAFVEMVVFAGLWLSQNRWEAGFALLLVGFQLGNTGVMLTALRAATPAGRVGVAISLFGISPSLGFALGPAVGGWLVDHGFLNLHTLFLLDSAISLVAGLVILAFAREARRTVVPTGSAVTQAVQAVRLTLTTPITLAVFGVFGIVYFSYSMANPFLPLLVVRLHGTAGDIGLIFGATAVVGALLSPVAGAAGDRIGFKVVLIAAGALAAASLAELAWAPNFLWLAVGSTVLGAAAATAISMVFSLLATAVPEERRATTLNLVLLPIYFASIIGGVIGAVLVRQSLNLVLTTSAAVSLAAALLTTRLPSAGRRDQHA